MYNITNRIKQPSQCCQFCGKSYIKKTNLNNHIILCELLHTSSKMNANEIEEVVEIPSQKKIYQMLLELSKKVNGLDKQMEEVNKWVVKRKKKINVIEWLNEHMKPEFNFDNLSNEITILEEDINCLFNSTFIDVINHIFERSIYTSSDEKMYPIFAFVQKSGVFYIYENHEVKWIELNKERLGRFLDKIYMKISREFSAWKKANKLKIDNDEHFQLLCDKTSVKFYSCDVKNETIFSKIKSNMFSKMKTDMKSLIEYEFEF